MDQDDEAGFGRARDWLLDGFGGWLRAESGLDDAAAAEAVGDAGIALDWKFGYGSGNLGCWTAGDLTEFLLGWCPRKLSVSQADSRPAAPEFAEPDGIRQLTLTADILDPHHSHRALGSGASGCNSRRSAGSGKCPFPS
jgi:hypothetical protein